MLGNIFKKNWLGNKLIWSERATLTYLLDLF